MFLGNNINLGKIYDPKRFILINSARLPLRFEYFRLIIINNITSIHIIDKSDYSNTNPVVCDIDSLETHVKIEI